MTRFPGFSASNFAPPGVCATIRFLDRRIWGINHGNRDQDPAHAASGWQVHQCHRQNYWPLSPYRSQIPSPITFRDFLGVPFSIAKRSCEAGFRPLPLCALSAARNTDLKGMVVISSSRSQMTLFKPHRLVSTPLAT